ncbi:outer membrane beta-barrel protein [Rufibacter radiotolerans]|uniref:outer membrane beta-barrel protein n=1 Tax=Rufibacter radiotolerans TaxID=1379910 RepID=UPI0006647456|nr:outer membrane beta-barrel protein [Rufibacter radiotolerans]
MLKKFFFAATFCLSLSFAASAQDSGAIKPAAGEVTGEVQLSLSSGNTVGLSLNQLRGRYFLAPDMAVRASFSLSLNTEDYDDNFNRSSSYVSIAPGIEKHFAGTDRLSPYVGAELSISKFSAHEESSFEEIEGAWSNGNGIANRNYFGLGLGAVAGADYYFAKHVYLGVEFGLGFQYRTYGEVERDPKNSGNTITYDDDRNNLSLNPTVNTGLRLGFVF